MEGKKLLYLLVLFVFCIKLSCANNDKYLRKISQSNHEQEAMKILNEIIYNSVKIENSQALKITKERKWLKASKLIIDFLTNLNDDLVKEVQSMIESAKSYTSELRSLLKEKKKNIVTISPVFEWSQDNNLIKIRVKFAKNLESPGEKNIENLKVICKRSNLIVHGYKVHDEYVANYFRDIKLYDLIKHQTCNYYKETEGSYIIKFKKNQPTLYWNHLDLFTEDHFNMYTWFDVFTQYDDKAKYTEFREFTRDNLLEKDINDHLQEKMEEKKLRRKKIKQILKFLKTKDYENKNFCNSPVNENFCLIVDIYDWNYWLS
jgi:hypothetical protein